MRKEHGRVGARDMEIETQTSQRSFTVRKGENEAIMGQENRIKRVFHFFNDWRNTSMFVFSWED